MKIVLISNITPTPDNFRAASALSYHLIKYRPNDIDIIVYTFNSNGVDKDVISEIELDLNVRINIIPRSRMISLLFLTHTIFLKNFLRYPFDYYNKVSNSKVKEIVASQPDGIWVNGDSLSLVIKQFPKYCRVHTMPDCVPLYYHRLMGDNYLFHNFYQLIGKCIQYYKNIRMEQEYSTDENIHYHLVGENDRQYLLKINPKLQTSFIRHPHYNIKEKKIKFSQPKIKIIIAGQYNLYMQTAFDELLTTLCNHEELAQYYNITFLGKGWDFAVSQLIDVGFETYIIDYVDVYLNELIKYDVQLTPISVGTGTKGKVLDALANGLLVIGTNYAMENIAVENGKSCIEYQSPDSVVSVLNDIPKNICKYEIIAEEGRRVVRAMHNREIISQQLFNLFI